MIDIPRHAHGISFPSPSVLPYYPFLSPLRDVFLFIKGRFALPFLKCHFFQPKLPSPLPLPPSDRELIFVSPRLLTRLISSILNWGGAVRLFFLLIKVHDLLLLSLFDLLFQTTNSCRAPISFCLYNEHWKFQDKKKISWSLYSTLSFCAMAFGEKKCSSASAV